MARKSGRAKSGKHQCTFYGGQCSGGPRIVRNEHNLRTRKAKSAEKAALIVSLKEKSGSIKQKIGGTKLSAKWNRKSRVHSADQSAEKAPNFCLLCASQYSTSSNFKRHMSTVHAAEDMQQQPNFSAAKQQNMKKSCRTKEQEIGPRANGRVSKISAAMAEVESCAAAVAAVGAEAGQPPPAQQPYYGGGGHSPWQWHHPQRPPPLLNGLLSDYAISVLQTQQPQPQTQQQIRQSRRRRLPFKRSLTSQQQQTQSPRSFKRSLTKLQRLQQQPFGQTRGHQQQWQMRETVDEDRNIPPYQQQFFDSANDVHIQQRQQLGHYRQFDHHQQQQPQMNTEESFPQQRHNRQQQRGGHGVQSAQFSISNQLQQQKVESTWRPCPNYVASDNGDRVTDAPSNNEEEANMPTAERCSNLRCRLLNVKDGVITAMERKLADDRVELQKEKQNQAERGKRLVQKEKFLESVEKELEDRRENLRQKVLELELANKHQKNANTELQEKQASVQVVEKEKIALLEKGMAEMEQMKQIFEANIVRQLKEMQTKNNQQSELLIKNNNRIQELENALAEMTKLKDSGAKTKQQLTDFTRKQSGLLLTAKIRIQELVGAEQKLKQTQEQEREELNRQLVDKQKQIDRLEELHNTADTEMKLARMAKDALGTRIAELETLLAASNDKLAMEKRKNDQRIETAMRALQGQLPIGMHEPMNVRDQQTNNNGQGAQGIQQQQQQQCSSQSASATGNGGGGKQMEQCTSRSSSHSLPGLEEADEDDEEAVLLVAQIFNVEQKPHIKREPNEEVVMLTIEEEGTAQRQQRVQIKEEPQEPPMPQDLPPPPQPEANPNRRFHVEPEPAPPQPMLLRERKRGINYSETGTGRRSGGEGGGKKAKL